MEESVRQPKTWDQLSEQYGGLNLKLAENCVEYAVFVLPEVPLQGARELLSSLDSIKHAALELVARLTKDYIWQREEFSLAVKNDSGLIYLHGITDYGDSLEDEWLIVFILREVSRLYPQTWIRVWDADGEFLLVEAANMIPQWLSPSMDSNRSWIHNEKLLVIPPDATQSGSLSLTAALARVKANPDDLFHSPNIDKEAFYRLEKYPGHISLSLHHAKARIPRKLAYLLHKQPKVIAPAVEEFYLRDPIALACLESSSTMLKFPPDDLVIISVRFTKVLFAQLYSQRFEPLGRWRDVMEKVTGKQLIHDPSAAGAKSRLEYELGMKLTCGFEMLLRKASTINNRFVREAAILLEDIDEDGPAFLPTDETIRTWPEVDRDDDDRWMDIDFQELDNELNGLHRNSAEASDKQGFNDPSAQADLRKIVSRFELFLNNETSGADGAELDSDQSADDPDDDHSTASDDHDEDSRAAEGEEADFDVALDESRFASLLKEFLDVDQKSEGHQSPQPADDMPGTQNAEVMGVRQLMESMEAELKKHGALALDTTSQSLAALKDDKCGDGGKSSKDVGTRRVSTPRPEMEEEGEVNVDYNLAKNLLESFKGQAGAAGPVSNILGMMGLHLPRDEDADIASHDEESAQVD